VSEISVQKRNENRPTTLTAYEPRLEQFRTVRDLMNWDPFREMSPYAPNLASGFAPSFEVKESKDAYLFKADLPGVKESDLEITMTGNRLTVSGKREAEKQEQNETYYAYERSYGSFARFFTLPDGVDSNGVHADLKEGVLSLTVRKTPEAQPKRITVQTANTKKP
jgi:HSP20 family protein